ncbi:MAG: glycosyltransferase [Bradyrhizobium sp.]|nr:glycosyltransferase [Bradyrhizobium sp.]
MTSTSRPIRLIPQTAQPIDFSCPLCGTVHAAYFFSGPSFKVYRCGGCDLTFGKPIAPIVTQVPTNRPQRTEDQHKALISLVTDELLRGHVLLFADTEDSLIPMFRQLNVDVQVVGDENDLRTIGSTTRFDAVVVSDAIMRVADPCNVLKTVRSLVSQGAPLILSVPLLDEPQAKLMGRDWHEWQPSNRWYFTRETLHLALLSAGFGQVWFEPERRTYSLDSLTTRLARREELSLWQHGLIAMHRLFPKMLQSWKFPLPSGTIIASSVASEKRQESVVSIIVPVFNEQATVRQLLDSLLTKPLANARMEVIIVESNSTDGSRQIVNSYAHRDGVKIILQPNPRGKGCAVREGLAAATGDIILIQDADLEYDLDDYEGLLQPLMAWQSIFVLGSRHQSGWKMRKFTDAPLMAAVLNMGHQFFRTLMNVSLRAQMTDPFTMFKVFRRDALFGIDLKSNRFDLDIELVMKLVRKGYLPLEIPVNYASRSFAEGKKVSFMRDGMTWIGTIIRYRLDAIGPGRVVWK